MLSDPGGQGGAGGDLGGASDAKSAHGVVELANIPTGEYDVLAVCTGISTVHIDIKTVSSLGKVLASSDIACGATLRLPVTVTSPGIILEATNTGTPAQWYAAIVTPGWEPNRSAYSP